MGRPAGAQALERLTNCLSDLNPDPYSAAHLSEASVRIEKALDADYIYNTSDIGGGGGAIRFIMEDEAKRLK